MPYTIKNAVNTRYTSRETLIKKLQNMFRCSRLSSDFDVKVKLPNDLLAYFHVILLTSDGITADQ